MKLNRLVFPCLIAMNLALCSCNYSEELVQEISVEVNQKTKMLGDSFSLNDLNVYFDYGHEKKLIEPFEFEYYGVNAFLHIPNNENVNLSFDETTLKEVGTYNVEVTYNLNDIDNRTLCGWDSFYVEERIIPATSLTLGSDSIALSEESTQAIDYLVLPRETTSTVTFESNDTSVATVDENGVVTAVNEGLCIVKASVDGIEQECLVTVSPLYTIEYVFTNNEFQSQNGGWIYSTKGDDKQVNGVSISEQTIITSPMSFNDVTRIKYDCPNNSIIGIDDDNGEISTYIGDELIGTSSVNYNGSQQDYVYNVDSKTGYVKLDIKPNSRNDANVSIKSISITYDAGAVYPTSISLKDDNSIVVNDLGKITVSYNPVNTNRRDIEWFSSNEDVLTVGRDGTIYAHSCGEAIVTAKVYTPQGYVEDSTTVEVYKIPVESIELDFDELCIYETESKAISYNVLPANASYKEVTFESSNPNVATVDATGNITGMSEGECTINVRSSDDNSICSYINVTVKEKPVLEAKQMSYLMSDYTSLTGSIDSAPSIGKTKLLVIPVWFTDSSKFISNKEAVREDIEKVYFGTEKDTGWQSVKTFYETEANGRLSLNGTVSEWYDANKSYTDFNYATDTESSKYANNTPKLIKDATNWYFSNHDSDNRKNYDCDGDGYLDGVIIIYGCPDYANLEKVGLSKQSKDNLWAYTYWLQESKQCNKNNPGPNSYFWASYDFMYSEDKAYERTGKTNYASGNTSHLKLDPHTFIHEMGHIFGLEDYYDYSGNYIPAGGFSMQDYNVGGHDPFSCLTLGWADAYIPVCDSEIILKPFQSSHEVIILSPSFNDANSPFDEYLLLELYTPTGLNKFDCDYKYGEDTPTGVKDSGIRVWHVDSRLVQLNMFGSVNDPKSNFVIPTKNCDFMMSNTYSGGYASAYTSVCGEKYANYNLLQLIRNNSSVNYKPKNFFDSNSLYKDGSTFEMSKVAKQFVNTGKLNSGKQLGWSFSVSLSGYGENTLGNISLKKN